jgi:hypothetical protein
MHNALLHNDFSTSSGSTFHTCPLSRCPPYPNLSPPHHIPSHIPIHTPPSRVRPAPSSVECAINLTDPPALCNTFHLSFISIRQPDPHPALSQIRRRGDESRRDERASVRLELFYEVGVLC